MPGVRRIAAPAAVDGLGFRLAPRTVVDLILAGAGVLDDRDNQAILIAGPAITFDVRRS